MTNLVISNHAISQDKNGFFSLNDLHKSAGGASKHQPSNFMRNAETQELIKAIERQNPNSSNLMSIAYTTTEGKKGGTFVCRELVYRYAMWISPKFSLMVIRAFDAMNTGAIPCLTQPTQRTATPAELHAIKTKVHFISGNFHFKEGASAEIYNRLRVELHLPNIADIQPHQLDRAYAILDEIDRNAKSYAEFRYELDELAQGAIIRQGRPYTPHVKAKLTKLGATIGHAPNWHALQTLIQ